MHFPGGATWNNRFFRETGGVPEVSLSSRSVLAGSRPSGTSQARPICGFCDVQRIRRTLDPYLAQLRSSRITEDVIWSDLDLDSVLERGLRRVRCQYPQPSPPLRSARAESRWID